MKTVIPITSLILLANIAGSLCDHLIPPYFNAAEKGEILATATCGDEGGKEEYCQFNEKHTDVYTPPCGHFCDLADPALATAAENSIDGSARTWQSPPLSRGDDVNKYSRINLTVHLGHEFEVHYVSITMGNSPRPAVWSLERSADFGLTWSAWQYFAPSRELCLEYFGTTETNLTADDTIICDTSFSRLRPFQHGEIYVSLLNGRPSVKDYYQSSTLQQWTKATNVRLRLIKTGIDLLEDTFLTPNRMSKFFKKYFFYSIMKLNITATCPCNGHGEMCTITDRETTCHCHYQHNTCGDHCEYCCPGHFRSTQNPADGCEKCDCHLNGTVDQVCNKANGQCMCRDGFTGARCDQPLPVYIVDMIDSDDFHKNNI